MRASSSAFATVCFSRPRHPNAPPPKTGSMFSSSSSHATPHPHLLKRMSEEEPLPSR